MEKNTIASANSLFLKQDYIKAFEQYNALTERKLNPAFCSFMAGKCLILSDKKSEGYTYYKNALQFDDSNAFINREVEEFMLLEGMVSSEKMIFFHYFPHTPNIGDSGSAAGIRHIFRSLTDKIFFYSLSCRNDTFLKIKNIKCRPDGIIIGGGGLFFSQPLPSGWYFPLSAQELDELTLPVVTYAVGFNQEFSKDSIWDLNNDFVQNIIDFHASVTVSSVRDLWSKDILKKYNLNDVHLVPCPSAYLPSLTWYDIPECEHGKIIGFSITDRSITENQREAFSNSIVILANWFKENNFIPLFIFQDSSDDSRFAQWLAHKKYTCIFPNTAREAVSIYKKCYAVIGMRGHSVILAGGQCVPVFAVAYNKKVEAVMEILDLSEYCIHQNDLSDTKKVVTKVMKFLSERTSIINKLKLKYDLFYTMNCKYCKTILDVMRIKF